MFLHHIQNIIFALPEKPYFQARKRQPLEIQNYPKTKYIYIIYIYTEKS